MTKFTMQDTKLKMQDADTRAIDLLLDRDANSRGTSVSADGALRQRIVLAEKLLGLLDNLSAGEPSPDLVARTLRHVAQNALPAQKFAQPAAFLNQPIV